MSTHEETYPHTHIAIFYLGVLHIKINGVTQISS